MRAAEGLIADATVEGAVVTAAVRRAAARIIDTAAGLPELIAERDALRKALREYVERQEAEGNASGLPEYEQAMAALALNTKGQP